ELHKAHAPLLAAERGSWVVYVQADYRGSSHAIYEKLGDCEEVLHFIPAARVPWCHGRIGHSRRVASHCFAAPTSASKAPPLSSNARLSAASSGCSMPVSSSGILSSRTAFMSRAISPAA